LAQPIKRLGKTLRRRTNEQRQLGATLDLLHQSLGLGMAIGLGLIEVGLEDALRQLAVAGVGSMPGERQRNAQGLLVVGGDLLVGGLRLGAAAGDVGEERAVIAQIELGPIR